MATEPASSSSPHLPGDADPQWLTVYARIYTGGGIELAVAAGRGRRRQGTVEQARDTAQGVAAALRGRAVRLGMIVKRFEIRREASAETAPAPATCRRRRSRTRVT